MRASDSLTLICLEFLHTYRCIGRDIKDEPGQLHIARFPVLRVAHLFSRNMPRTQEFSSRATLSTGNLAMCSCPGSSLISRPMQRYVCRNSRQMSVKLSLARV